MYRKFSIWGFAAAIVFFSTFEVSPVSAEEASETADKIGKATSKSVAELVSLLLFEKSPCDPAGTAFAKIKAEHSRSDQYIGWLEQYTAPYNVDASGLGYMRLQIADAALKSGCLDIANAQYRKVLSNYSSFRYIGLRDRAKVGIDDVRVKLLHDETKRESTPPQTKNSHPLKPGESVATYTVEPGETLEGILRSIGAFPDEASEVTKLFGGRGRPDGLLPGRQTVRVVTGPTRDWIRKPLLRVEILSDGDVEAAVEKSNSGAFVAVNLLARNK